MDPTCVYTAAEVQGVQTRILGLYLFLYATFQPEALLNLRPVSHSSNIFSLVTSSLARGPFLSPPSESSKLVGTEALYVVDSTLR